MNKILHPPKTCSRSLSLFCLWFASGGKSGLIATSSSFATFSQRNNRTDAEYRTHKFARESKGKSVPTFLLVLLPFKKRRGNGDGWMSGKGAPIGRQNCMARAEKKKRKGSLRNCDTVIITAGEPNNPWLEPWKRRRSQKGKRRGLKTSHLFPLVIRGSLHLKVLWKWKLGRGLRQRWKQ